MTEMAGVETVATPSLVFVEWLVGDLQLPCDYSERRWGFSHGPAKWAGFLSPCACGEAGQRLFCEGCYGVFSRDDNCFTCTCGDVTAPARHAFSRLERL